MGVWGSFIRECVDGSSRSISVVNFKGFRFSKEYKMFGGKEGLERNFLCN